MYFTLPLDAAYWEPQAPKGCSAEDTRRVKSAAARLRRQVSLWVGESPDLTNHLDWLARNGFNREDSRQIRYTVEVFYCCEPMFTITHALGPGSDSSVRSFANAIGAGSLAVPLAAATQVTSLIPRPVTEPHAFFRALAMWPRYAELVSREMLAWHPFPQLVLAATREARALAGRIQTHHPAKDSSSTQASREKLIASCEVLVATCALRRMIVNAEVAARATAEAAVAGGAMPSTTV